MNNTENDLESALRQCQTSAHRGYKIASDNLKETASAIDEASKSLSKCLQSYDDGSVRTPEIVAQLKKQLVSSVKDLKQLQNRSEKDLKNVKNL